MSDPGFASQCQVNGLSHLSQISQSNSVLIYKGQFSTYFPVVIKHFHHLDQASFERKANEYSYLSPFNDSVYIVNVLHTFAYRSSQSLSFVVIQEWIEKDLTKEISDRRKNRNFWTNSEIKGLSLHLIHTFAMLQEQGITHRDISPGSVFIDARNLVKVGNFGYARRVDQHEIEGNAQLTIIGTPLYMSPELGEFRVSQVFRGAYNPYKSDVYSLGLTLLLTYKLQTEINQLDIGAEVASIQYDQLREMIGYMLGVDPGCRPDFIQLRDYYSTQPPHVLPIPRCPHLAEEDLNYYQFECHGRFCMRCVSTVVNSGAQGELVHVANCPKCQSIVELAIQSDFAPVQQDQGNRTLQPLRDSSCIENQEEIARYRERSSESFHSLQYQAYAQLQQRENARAIEILQAPVFPASYDEVEYSHSVPSVPEIQQTPSRPELYLCNPEAFLRQSSVPASSIDQIPEDLMNQSAKTEYCIQCRTKIAEVPSSEPIENQVVLLNCPQCLFICFCNRKCFQTYVEIESNSYCNMAIVCIRCRCPINYEEIVRNYGGEEELTLAKIKAAERGILCVYCNVNKPMFVLSNCGHIYCKRCLERIKQGSKYRCRKCNAISEASWVKRLFNKVKSLVYRH